MQKKRQEISINAKQILENWFQSNISYPYATSSDIIELSSSTKLDEQKIKNWLQNKRNRTKNADINNRIPVKCFSLEDKKILTNYFQKNTEHPGPEDLTYLKNMIKKDEKKIRQWFNHQRFKCKLREKD